MLLRKQPTSSIRHAIMAKKKRPVPRRSKTKKKPVSLEVIHLVACDGVARDPNTGKATLYGLFDRLIVEKVPSPAGGFSVYAKLGGYGKYPISIDLVRPDGSADLLLEATIDIPKTGYAQVHAIIAGIEMKQYGRHWIQVKSGRRKVGSPYSLEIVKTKA